MPHSLPQIPFFQRALATAQADPDKVALIDGRTGESRSYRQLLLDVVSLADSLLQGSNDLQGERIAGLVPNGYSWVVAQWATWAAGGLFVPLLHSLPAKEMLYIVQKSTASRLIVCSSLSDRGAELAAVSLLIKHITTLPTFFPLYDTGSVSLPTISSEPFDLSRDGFMLFTSGSTGNPKGVPMRHSALASQCASMSEAWAWSCEDRILHVLPMHHIHGVVNVLLTALWNGATCEFMPKFDAPGIWERFISPNLPQLTLFMAVPAIYSRLLDVRATFSSENQQAAQAACERFRLMVSGSAPLPTSLKAAWKEIGGGVLLERYGMTETGMILSCGLDVSMRVDGHVGQPMPGVSVRLVCADTGTVIPDSTLKEQGEIQVMGPNIFTGYWDDPATTAKEFVVDKPSGDRWFKTGDIGIRDAPSEGGYRVLGRLSVDIIKSGGEKISALEIERALLALPNGLIHDCAVVAVPDPKWGEAVGAVVVLGGGGSERSTTLEVKELRELLRSELAAFKLPQKLKIYKDQIPRNAMGKVNKKELVKTAFPEETKRAACGSD